MSVGVTTNIKIKNIMIGAIIFPRTSPNLTQSVFSGVRRLEFINPRTKKITK